MRHKRCEKIWPTSWRDGYGLGYCMNAKFFGIQVSFFYTNTYLILVYIQGTVAQGNLDFFLQNVLFSAINSEIWMAPNWHAWRSKMRLESVNLFVHSNEKS